MLPLIASRCITRYMAKDIAGTNTAAPAGRHDSELGTYEEIRVMLWRYDPVEIKLKMLW